MRSAKLIQIRRHAFFDRPKFDVTTAFSQLCQVGLRVALVRALEMIGERDVANPALAVPVDHGLGHVL